MTQQTKQRMEPIKKIQLKDLNELITCALCKGYLVDATTIVDCLDVFCRSCILRHFEYNKTECPKCGTLIKKKSQSCFRADPQIQALVYKLVPRLYAKEMQRREDFYRSTGVRASSSCSDDSVLERERDMINDQEETISKYVGDKTQFFSPDDSISLSLEYYQLHLDTTPLKTRTGIESALTKCDTDDKCADGENEKRFLQCPAAVSITLLQKFIRMKYGLTNGHKVDIVYAGEVLPLHYTLMDVAYVFKWTRIAPLRFFYRIFTPLKVQPIKIVVNTKLSLSTGGKQLQIVKPEQTRLDPLDNNNEETEDQKNHKERLFAHLQLQSKTKVQNNNSEKRVPDKPIQDCVFDYNEQDREEIKRFAEKRDREWANMMKKKVDENRSNQLNDATHHFTKKRKKNKHSKNESSVHKKRKLHAEITSNEEEDLKLKVKLTPHNGHKHKHHKSSAVSEKSPAIAAELTNKEKLLQMRQVRHKNIQNEVPIKLQTVDTQANKSELKESEKNSPKVSEKTTEIVPKKAEIPPNNCAKEKLPIENKKSEIPSMTPIKTVDKVLPKQIKPAEEIAKLVANTVPSGDAKPSPKPPLKSSLPLGWNKKVPTVKIERNEQTEKQAQKTFLKTFQSHADTKTNKIEKITKPIINNTINTNNKILDRKIANLQQHCTIETKSATNSPKSEKIEKKVSFNIDKPTIMNPQYPPGFTVSKIETGVKRKPVEDEKLQDKRPSLEITLINPLASVPPVPKPPEMKPVTAKRPPPATIPLDRIKKSVNLKSGICIIPKMERCDNIGALDLSNKSPDASPRNEHTNGLLAGKNRPTNSPTRPSAGTEKNIQLSNLQMLSKVASEHPNLNKAANNNVNKVRPQMPNLQTIKIPLMQHPSCMKPTPNLQKLPKLNEIQKFRSTVPQIRNLRPNQNQNIRNIPNPSLLIRQQNQNRLNSITNSMLAHQASNAEKEAKVTTNSAVAVTTTSPSTTTISKETKNTIEMKGSEKKEISV